MKTVRYRDLGTIVLLSVFACLASVQAQAQPIPRAQLADTLAAGGHVIVMRHANSPRDLPDAATRNADNVDGERQLDALGRRTAQAMGEALRSHAIPVGEVLSSPTYRAMETARLLGFDALPVELLSNEGMREAGAQHATWLQDAVARPATNGNRLLITHGPNLSAAFPEHSQGMGEGEALVFRPGAATGPTLIHRIRIEDWAGL